VAGLAVAEAEIVADRHYPYAQLVHEDIGDELFGRKLRDFGSEGENEDLLDAFIGHQGGAFVAGSHQRRCAIGSHDARRVRIEGQGARTKLACGGQFADTAEDAAVSGVKAVEVADGEGGGTEIRRNLGEAAKDPQRHQRGSSRVISRPSYASRMCGGNSLSARSCWMSWQMCVKKARRGVSLATVWMECATVECVGWGL